MYMREKAEPEKEQADPFLAGRPSSSLPRGMQEADPQGGPTISGEGGDCCHKAPLGVGEAGPRGQKVDGGLMSDLLLISRWRNAHRQG